jgi:hypothetical protein
MTRMTNARVAGSAFLLYIVLGLPAGMLMTRATSAEGIAAKLIGVAQHANDLRVAVVLVLFSSFCALVLGVTLYAITREVDPDLAMLALTFRVGDGVIGGISVQRSLGRKCQDSRRCETTTFSVYISKNPLLLITPPGTST